MRDINEIDIIIDKAWDELDKNNKAIINVLIDRLLLEKERVRALSKILVEKNIVDENELDEYFKQECSKDNISKDIDELFEEIEESITEELRGR